MKLLRPQAFRRTPLRLASALEARSFRYPLGPRSQSQTFDYTSDVILCWANASIITGPRDTIHRLSNFYNSNKSVQRQLLQSDGVHVPTVQSVGGRGQGVSDEDVQYVVRPLHHHGGQGWRITDNPEDYNPQTEYVAEVFPKTDEYRLIYVKGQHLITLRKEVPEGLSSSEPWNHANGSRFITINDWNTCRLRNTSVLADLQSSPIITSAHLLGVDVLYDRETQRYVVCEVNFCPGLEIEANFNKVVEALRNGG